MTIEDHTKDIAAYLEGLLEGDDLIVFEKRYATSPEFRKEVDDYRFIWEQAQALKAQSQFHLYENWHQLQHRVHRASSFLRAWNGIRTVAAILLLPLGITLFYLLALREEVSMSENELIEVSSASGLVSKITLPDSSLVWLNSGSTLVYPRKFAAGSREVKLTGEAFFKVKADKDSRFDVEVPGAMTVSAYGTEFNVSAYKEDTTVEAVLAEGHIEVKAGASGSFKRLAVSQGAIFDTRSGRMQVVQCNLAEKLAWKEGKIVFRRAGIDQIVKCLMRHFNVDMVVQGQKSASYEFSATFTDETLPEILSILAKTTPMEYKVEEPVMKEDQTYRRRKVTLVLEKN